MKVFLKQVFCGRKQVWDRKTAEFSFKAVAHNVSVQEVSGVQTSQGGTQPWGPFVPHRVRSLWRTRPIGGSGSTSLLLFRSVFFPAFTSNRRKVAHGNNLCFYTCSGPEPGWHMHPQPRLTNQKGSCLLKQPVSRENNSFVVVIFSLNVLRGNQVQAD